MSILDDIVANKKAELSSKSRRTVVVESLRDRVNARGRRDFIGALKSPRQGDIALIAEVKKASPSAGVICEDFDPVVIACEYEDAGASCLSVLTDEHFFQGSLEYLRAIREAVGLPLLRKDFIIDERQIEEAVEFGADAILLIVAILNDEHLAHLNDVATNAGLAVLVEVHDVGELRRAKDIGSQLIGVNNRNLNTFSVDLGTTEHLATELEEWGGVLVAESGIHTRSDVDRLAECGARAILVGESLMCSHDIKSKAAELLGLS